MAIPDKTRCAPEQWAALHDFTRDAGFDVMNFEQENGDGLTFSGYAAVFNVPTIIDSWDGEFEETIAPGAFANSLRSGMPVLMFEHGRHPLIGSMPLGVINEAREDAKGLYISARLTDNWLIQPVRDAVRDGAVEGMSFRFTVPDGGDTWVETKGQMPQRTLTELDVRELGPVVFPAFKPTTASVRSLLDKLAVEDFAGRSDTRSTGGGTLVISNQTRVRDRMLRMKGIVT